MTLYAIAFAMACIRLERETNVSVAHYKKLISEKAAEFLLSQTQAEIDDWLSDFLLPED